MRKLTTGILLCFSTILLMYSGSCNKDSIFHESYFSLKINSVVGEYEPQSVVVKNGITVIAAKNGTENNSESVVITINGAEVGTYRQVFDYKTGVSVKSCGLTYKINSKTNANLKSSPDYYTSYEGEIVISKMDDRNKLMSGYYKFYLQALNADTVTHEIKGEFLNLPYH